MISLRACAFPAFHEVHHLHAHHHFTLLIQHFDERADDAAVGAGFRAAGFDDGGSIAALFRLFELAAHKLV